jgi:serine/threonine protein kinase
VERFLGNYKILSQLGAGGAGVVYTAQDLRLKRHVALKVLSGQFGADSQAKDRFLAEARAAAALDHPNIGTIPPSKKRLMNSFLSSCRCIRVRP